MKKRTLTAYKKLAHYINTNNGRWEQSCKVCKGMGSYKVLLQLDIDDYQDAHLHTWETCEECNGTGIASLSNEEYLNTLLHSLHQDVANIYNSECENDINQINSSVVNLLIELLDYAEFRQINIEKELVKLLLERKGNYNEK